jgi:hypothetical protein
LAHRDRTVKKHDGNTQSNQKRKEGNSFFVTENSNDLADHLLLLLRSD